MAKTAIKKRELCKIVMCNIQSGSFESLMSPVTRYMHRENNVTLALSFFFVARITDFGSLADRATVNGDVIFKCATGRRCVMKLLIITIARAVVLVVSTGY